MDESAISYPTIETIKKFGNEQFINTDRTCHTLSDFWSWAYSDLIGNTERGKLAEYIVAMALDIETGVSISWDKYDLKSVDGICIEVKSSGYLQTWEQKNISKISFGIQPTLAWNNITNEYETDKKRQSDIYVFCVLKHIDQSTINPLDVSQWDFYVLPTYVLNETLPNQKTITLDRLLHIGAIKCEFSELSDRIKL